MCRRHNPQRAKLHCSYSVLELASLFDVNITTISHWVSAGLSPIDATRPYLFSGVKVRQFLHERNIASKRPCKPGEIFCVACKRQQCPTGGKADVEVVSKTSANLVGTCPACARRIYRRVRLENMHRDCGGLSLTFKDRDDHINAGA